MFWMAAALAHTCEDVGLEEIVARGAPAVIVLGERHGSKTDMKRALSVVQSLADKGPVTLAMEAVHESNQGVLDAFAKGDVKAGALPAELKWSETWGFPWKPYKKLVTSSKNGVTVIAAGLDLGPKPEEREIEVPEGYDAFLKESMGAHAHQMSEEVQARFATSMAWRDFRIAELAATPWNGEGYLVVLAGRGHLEGGLGTNWQLPKLVEAPVFSVVLNHEDARCLEGDRVWAD
ncbi:MAG: ChaN family lipoprotein [Alphaproteobacteria bacterium]|nr:ChaN family lipoprotein [Alphaproteobacteria bacterium]